MDRKSSLIIAIIITALIIGNYLFFTDRGVVRERVEISEVLDGDTVELSDGRRIRLLNINTPEKGFPYSDLAKEFLTNFTSVDLEAHGKDRYQRILGKLYFNDMYLNLEIVEEGMAHTYLVLSDEEVAFDRAESQARTQQRNMWKKSSFSDCLTVEINKYDEYVDITDSCDVDFTGWTIKDESTRSYKFDGDVSTPLRLYSKEGNDNGSNLYWGLDNIWNNDHDEIFIRDSDGLLVYYYSYG